jgi:hypothetical protein
VKGVEVEDDVVLVVDVVPIRDGCADSRRVSIVGNDAEVNSLRRIPDEDLGFFLRATAIHRLILPEAREPSSLRPDRFIELPVDLNGGLETGNLRGGRALPLDNSAKVWAGALKQQEKREHGPLG